jgi:hypothetical protein
MKGKSMNPTTLGAKTPTTKSKTAFHKGKSTSLGKREKKGNL